MVEKIQVEKGFRFWLKYRLRVWQRFHHGLADHDCQHAPAYLNAHRPLPQRQPIRHDLHRWLGVDIDPAHQVMLDARVLRTACTHALQDIAKQFQLG